MRVREGRRPRDARVGGAPAPSGRRYLERRLGRRELLLDGERQPRARRELRARALQQVRHLRRAHPFCIEHARGLHRHRRAPPR
eukprot:6428447-Prymnesium_polylepis.1